MQNYHLVIPYLKATSIDYINVIGTKGFKLHSPSLWQKTKQWPREKTPTLTWPMLAKVMALTSSLTRKAPLQLAPDPDPDPAAAAVTADAPMAQVAPMAQTTTGDVVTTGDVTGHHHLHPAAGPLLAAGPPLAAGPALTLVATDLSHAVAVRTITDMAVAADPHHDATGPALVLSAARPHQTGTPATDATGPAPGLPAVGAGTGGLQVGFPHIKHIEVTQGPDLQGIPSA